MKNVSNIKTRIKEIAENTGDSLDTFFTKIGTTAANFRGKKLDTGVNSEIIVNIVSLYPDTDLHWLITGEKKTTIETPHHISQEPKSEYGIENEDTFKMLKAFFNKEHHEIHDALKEIKKQNADILDLMHRSGLADDIKRMKEKIKESNDKK